MKTLALLCAFLVCGGAAPLGDLYLPDDDVEILTADNFKKFVENSTSAWFVEFYASWCGYCQRFAPAWKAFATDAASWRDLVRVGVLDCSDEANIQVCRDFEITKYPTVRYFHENYHSDKDKLGVVVPHGDVNTLETVKMDTLNTFIAEQSEGRGFIFPNILPYSEKSVDGIFAEEKNNVEFVFLVFEPQDHHFGAEVAFDLHKTPNVTIRRSLKNNTDLATSLTIEKFPSVFVIDRQNNKKTFVENVVNRTEIKATIGTFLKEKGITIIETIPAKLQNSSVDPNPDTKTKSRTILRQYVKKMGDVIFQSDLEAALRYSLQQEVATLKVIEKEQLQALNAYLKVVNKYFPFGYNTTFIPKLINMTSGVQSIKGEDIQLVLKEAEEMKEFSSSQRFLGCLGSSNRYRGYPCSLWRLFHYFTVNSMLSNFNNKKANPREVLDAMHGYVKNFFSCVHCSKHFQEMAAMRKMTNVASLEESVFWLWEAHNVVNNRLNGDPTEDPEYPKIQFPSKLRCPSCYEEGGSWNKGEVMNYLKKMYSRYNVRYIGSDTSLLFPGLN